MGTYERSAAPVQTWRGRPILVAGSAIISRHWAIQPGSRPSGNKTVNISGGEAHRLVDQPGAEVDVGVHLALGKVAVRQRDLLRVQRDVE
jgi:hypothetical protein